MLKRFANVDARLERAELQVVEQCRGPTPTWPQIIAIRGIDLGHIARGKDAVPGVIGVQRDTDLMQVAGALRAASGFARALNRRDQQSNKNAHDRDHDQELNQREGVP